MKLNVIIVWDGVSLLFLGLIGFDTNGYMGQTVIEVPYNVPSFSELNIVIMYDL